MQFKRTTACLVLAAATVLSGCGNGAQQAQPPISVDVAAAKEQTLATYIALNGNIVPLEQATLSFQQSGPVQTVSVNIGDRVHRGQLLAQIDPSTLRAQLAQADAAAAQASASARGSQIGLPVAATSNASALATAKASLDNAQLVYQQNQQLFKQGYVSQQQLESARAAYVQAKSQYDAASAGLQNTAVSAQNVKASLAGAQSARAQANVLRTQLSQTALYAPFDGVVTARSIDPGSMAGPGAPALAVARVDSVWVNINIQEGDLAYVHPGSTIMFTTSTLPGKTFRGRVDTVNTVPTSGTLSYLARIHEPNPGEILRGGMLVDATAERARKDHAIVVPLSAIAQSDGGASVFIVESGKAVQVPVKVGLQTDTQAEVISSKVVPGTQVITTRPDTLQNGSAVAVNTPQSQGHK